MMKIKVFISILCLLGFSCFQSCNTDKVQPVKDDHSEGITVNLNDLEFECVNLSVGDGKITARGGITSEINWSVEVNVNGVITTVGGTKKENELPVRAGDEIELKFIQSCPEQTEAFFTMPDGSIRKTTVNEHSFRWTVPSNFIPGMEIRGESHYTANKKIYTKTGVVILIEL